MDLSKLMEDYIINKFLKDERLLITEEELISQSKESKIIKEYRKINDIFETVCWICSREGIYYFRLDSLINSKPNQGKFKLNKKTLTYPHKHSSVELAYVVKGKLQQRISGDDVEFSEGEICMIDKNSYHLDYLYPDDSMVVFMSIADSFITRSRIDDRRYFKKNIDDFLREVIIKHKEKYRYIRFIPKNKQNMETPKLIANILYELWNAQSGSTLIIQGYLERILSLLPVEFQFSLSKNEKNYIRELLFDEVVHYINEHYQNISIHNLCEKFSYNEDYFNRLIKEFTGLTYSKYLQSIRIDKAVVLLQTTKLPIHKIARLVGYNNIGYFYKIFYDKYNKTPDEFRQP